MAHSEGEQENLTEFTTGTDIRREARLLVVEDEPRMQRLLQSHLALNGWAVQVIGTAREALSVIAEEDPALICLVLLDIGLPDGDGLDVCRRVREWSNVPIILVTAADTPQLKVAALELGADDYLTKPFHTGELVARIRAVLRRARRLPVPSLCPRPLPTLRSMT